MAEWLFYVNSTADLFDFTQYATYSAGFFNTSDPNISSPVPTMGHLDITCIHFLNGKWERTSTVQVVLVLPLCLTICKSIYDTAVSVNWFFRLSSEAKSRWAAKETDWTVWNAGIPYRVTTACHWCLTWPRRIQTTHSYPVYLKTVLITIVCCY
jgi:hypothetical protein